MCLELPNQTNFHYDLSFNLLLNNLPACSKNGFSCSAWHSYPLQGVIDTLDAYKPRKQLNVPSQQWKFSASITDFEQINFCWEDWIKLSL